EKIRYDTPEANLVKMGQIYKDKGEYKAALYYYKAAHKINPDMKEAQDGTILLTNLILQTREQDLEAQIAIKQDTEEKMGKVTGKKNLSVSLGIRAEELQRRLGISIRVIDSQVKVDKVFKKSVAYEAGIKKGDTIISVWGKLVRYMQLEDVYTLLLSGTINELKMVIARKAPLVLNEKRIFRGAEEMIGGRLRTKFRGLMVISILEAGPLKKAGIIEGDLLIKIGESPTRYMPLESAYKLIEETKKGLLNLEIQRELAIWKRG
ncbi:MAG: PDZ domain-containing protein, partial [Candidatus Omnitrophica bacterium]|nr:PDZ domain-containing protein [Candidatus Omnitrophota bacterium]